jgi:hypothetical protein
MSRVVLPRMPRHTQFSLTGIYQPRIVTISVVYSKVRTVYHIPIRYAQEIG